jgi:dolichol-phosphate mannosyltransferase
MAEITAEVAGAVERQHSAQIAVIVPTLNEVENIDSLLAATLAQAAAGLNLQILVADGGSTDGTVERVRSWHGKAPVRLVASSGRRGLAGDVLAAAEQTEAPIVVVMDADFSHPPASIPQLVAPLLADERDMVVGSRYVAGGLTVDWPLRRYVLSRLGAMLAWPLTDLKDPMSGFFAVRREALLAIDPTVTGFKIGLEIIAVGGDALRVSEIPIAFSDRVHGTSKIGLLQLADYARQLLVLAGGAVSMGTAARFAAVGVLGLGVDFLVFHALFAAGLGVVAAHIASFILATLSNYILNSRWAFADAARRQSEPDWHRYLRFLAVCVLALALRGGVLATLVNAWGWRPELAILAGIGTAAAVNYLGSAFFVFPSLNPRVSSSVRWRMVALGIVGYVVALRLLFMGTVDLLPEEAYYWNYAQHLDIGYLDHPPMVAWLIWLGTTIFGQTEFAVRSGAILCWVTAAFFAFRLAHNLYGKTAAFIAVMLFSALPFFFAMGLVMVPDSPLTAAWAGALYFLERATLGERRAAWLGVGVCIGLGMLSKYTIALLGLATFIFLLVDAKSRRWLWTPWPYLAAVIAILLFSPVIAWNAANDWASFAFQSTRRLGQAQKFSLHLLVGSILLLITPVGLAAAVLAVAPAAGMRRLYAGSIDRKQAFVVVYTLTPLSVFVAFSLLHQVKLNWTGPLWLAVLPALARMLTAERHLRLFGLRPAWAATIAITLILYAAGLHYVALGLPGVPYPSDLRVLPIAWREFADAAGKIRDQVQSTTGSEPLLVGMDRYFLSSELAFYDRRGDDSAQSTAGRSLFGANSVMYDYWVSRCRQVGRTVIMFGVGPRELSQANLSQWFQSMGPVTEAIVYKAGARAGRFYYRVGYDFRPQCAGAQRLQGAASRSASVWAK